MSIVEKSKSVIAQSIVKMKFIHPFRITPFKNFFSESITFFVLMPADDLDFGKTLPLLRYFASNKKSITLFLPEYRYNLVPEKQHYKIFSFRINDINTFNLPKKSLIQRLPEKSYDVVVDLNRGDNIFYSAIANAVDAKFRLGFKKQNSDIFYNLQVINDENNGEISYRNLLNSLQMF